MTTDDRMKALLDKQAAAAQRRRDEEDNAKQKAFAAKQVMQHTEAAWKTLRDRLLQYIVELNEKMRVNGVELRVEEPESLGHDRLDVMTIAIGDELFGRASRTPGMAMRRLVIEVLKTGAVHARMGTTHVSHKKSGETTIADADIEKFLQNAVLDFLEINT